MDINELRAEVRRRQRAANKKVSRLKARGVQLGGTEFDPRREARNIGRYNTAQLKSYLSDLNKFTSRENAFVAGAGGTPIRRSTYEAYTRAQRRYNMVAESAYEAVKSTFIPSHGMTVEQFDAGMLSKRPGANVGATRPLAPFRRAANEIVSEERMRELTKLLETKARPTFVRRKIKSQRDQMMKALQEFGDLDLLERASKLTNFQLDVLWNYTDAPRDFFSGYHHAKLFAANPADETASQIHEDAAYETRQWVEWASQLKPNRKNRR